MMDYLKDVGFSSTMINNVILKNDKDTIEELDLYQNNVMKVIEYLKTIGIEDIYGLFLYRSYVFLEEVEYLKKLFQTCEINNIIEMINEDQVNFELLGL